MDAIRWDILRTEMVSESKNASETIDEFRLQKAPKMVSDGLSGQSFVITIPF